MTLRATLKQWFSRGKKPTAAQFAEWIDSFWHKSDIIQISDIKMLPQTLNDKSDVGHDHDNLYQPLGNYAPLEHEHSQYATNGNITYLQNQIDLLAQGVSEGKDVVAVSTYIDLEAIAEPSQEVIYKTLDSNKLYLYNGEDFDDVTGVAIDNTIYVSDIAELLSSDQEPGLYSILVVTTTGNTTTVSATYSFAVTSVTRLLQNKDGWAERVTIDGSYQWSWHLYSYAGHNHDDAYAAKNHSHSQYLTQHQDISGKQDETDNSLLTTVKTIVGAINELWNKFADYALSNHNHDGVYQPAGNYAAGNHNHDGVYQPAGNYATSDHTHPEYLTQHQDISHKQDKTDNSLPTTSKTIIGAIAELWNKFADYLKGIQHVTYAQLVTLRNNGELKPGQKYRITDFVTTTRSRYYNEDETDYRSAGHAFDLIVTADSSATLNKMAKATPHAGDTYFADADLSRWRIMYDLNNDQTRYDWADPENGKGVIYDMIDEWENHCRYDFKNIQYKRYKVTAVSNAALNDLIDTYALSSQGLTLDYDDYIWAYTFNVYGFTYTRDDENEDISVETDYQNSEDRSLNKREYLRAYASYNDGEDYTSDYNNSICHDNDIPAYYSMDEDLMDGENCYWRGYQQLNNIVFLHSAPDYDYSYDSGQLLYLLFYYAEPAYGNKFGVNCFCNTFGNYVYYNTFGNDVYGNTFGNSVGYNTFGNGVGNNTFGNDFRYNTFGNDVWSNTFGNSVGSNTFGNNVYRNTFGNNVWYNTFGNNVYWNTFGNDVYWNTFGNYVWYNTFGTTFTIIRSGTVYNTLSMERLEQHTIICTIVMWNPESKTCTAIRRQRPPVPRCSKMCISIPV